MQSQKKERRPGCCYLSSVLLVAVLVLPCSLENSTLLLCNHCPLQHKRESCSDNATTTCLADERCASSRGRYGGVLHVLSAQGCLAAALCGTHEVRAYRGARYNVSHACCCEDRCNRAPGPEPYLKALLGWLAHKTDFGSFAKNLIAEAPRDSPGVCEVLRVALLWLWLLPRPLLTDNLRCFYSPIQERDAQSQLVPTECPPHQLCFKGDGRYGNHSALVVRGCMEPEDCGRVREVRLKGTGYVMSFDCCSRPYCNAATPPTRGSPGLTLGAVPLGLVLARW